MTRLEDLYAKKQEIKKRRSGILNILSKANTALGEITEEFLAVDLEIRLEERRQNDRTS